MKTLRKLYEKVKNYASTHLGFSMAFSILGLLLAVMLILQSYVKNQYFAYLMEETDRRESAVLEALSANINRSLEDIVETGCQIAVDGEFRNTVDSVEDGRGRDELILKGAMRRMAQYATSVAAIAIVTEDGLLQEGGRYWIESGYEDLWVEEYQPILKDLYDEVMEKVRQSSGSRYSISEFPLSHRSLPGVGLFHFAVPLLGGSSSWESVDKVLVITFRMDAFIGEGMQNVYLTGSDGRILYHEDSRYAGMEEEAYRESLPQHRDIRCDLDYFGWTIHSLVDLERMYTRVNQLYRDSIFVYLLLLLFCAIVWQFVIRRLFKPVGTIREAMEDIRLGRQRKKIRIEGKHEIWQLAQDYNAMVDALHEQQEEVERQHLENTLSIKQKNRAEREALESQINAHFLCNTLTAINYKALEADNLEVASLLKNLSNMLAYSFSRSPTPITLGMEIRWVEEYLTLQKFRLMEVFDYRIDFPEEYGEWPTCKLFLQPFVENSILHGFEGMEKGGLIQIYGKPEGNRFSLSIRDNGRGMDEKAGGLIRRILSEPHILELEGFGIGIQNAVTRLRMYYGEEFAVTMETAPGEGTCFTFLLPLVEGEKEDFL